MKEIKIGNTVEQCVERSDYPPDRVREILKDEIVAVLGYGVQGRGQSLNMRDNGVKVIVGQRKGGKAYDLCLEDGWIARRDSLRAGGGRQATGTIIQYLLSDAGQKEMWPKIKPHLTKGKALYFSHGFSIVFSDQTGVIPPKDIDVILVRRRDRARPSAGCSWKAGASTAASPSTRTRPAAPASAAWRSASPSVRVISSRRHSRRKSSPT